MLDLPDHLHHRPVSSRLAGDCSAGQTNMGGYCSAHTRDRSWRRASSSCCCRVVPSGEATMRVDAAAGPVDARAPWCGRAGRHDPACLASILDSHPSGSNATSSTGSRSPNCSALTYRSGSVAVTRWFGGHCAARGVDPQCAWGRTDRPSRASGLGHEQPHSAWNRRRRLVRPRLVPAHPFSRICASGAHGRSRERTEDAPRGAERYGLRPRLATLTAMRPPGSSTRTHSANASRSSSRYSA